MSDMEMRRFKHKLTDKVGMYPAHFVRYDYMELVDEDPIEVEVEEEIDYDEHEVEDEQR